MAVTATHLETDGDSTDGDSFATGSVSLSANKLILLAVSSTKAGSPTTPTVTGASRTWTEVVSELGTSRRVTLFRSLSGSANSGALTIDFNSETQNDCQWSISEFENVDTTGTNGANAVVQSAGANDTTVTSLTVTLGGFSDAANATFGAIQTASGGSAITEGSGFSELGEATATAIIQSEWKNTNDTSVDWTFSEATAAGVAVEIKYVAPVLGGNPMFFGGGITVG